MKNQRQSARHSIENEGSVKHAKPIASRSTMGTTRIFPDPFLDGESGDLEKSRLSKPDTDKLARGYGHGASETTSKYGPLNLGNMPQLGERTKGSKRTTSIKQRSLK